MHSEDETITSLDPDSRSTCLYKFCRFLEFGILLAMTECCSVAGRGARKGLSF